MSPIDSQRVMLGKMMDMQQIAHVDKIAPAQIDPQSTHIGDDFKTVVRSINEQQNIAGQMMEAVDKGDSAQYNQEEVLNPKGWELLNFLMDARTGLGRFREFRISNYQLMMDLIDYCKNHNIDEILTLPDVKERVELYFEHEAKCKEQIKRCATVHGNLVVLDLRNEDTIYAGNRFVIYALFPQCNISIHVLWGLKQQNTVFATGKSIFDRNSQTNVGELMLRYNGGGHHAAGTCQVDNDKAQATLEALIKQINEDG